MLVKRKRKRSLQVCVYIFIPLDRFCENSHHIHLGDSSTYDMGYRTCLDGTINVSHRVHGPRLDYLTAFTQTRHMRLDVQQCEKIADPLRRAVDLPAGFWTIPDSWEAPVVLDMNCPGLAPSLNCPWEIYQDGSAIIWDGWEKPKGYVAWLVVLATLLKCWGHDVKGEIRYEGEEDADQGVIRIDTKLIPPSWTRTTGEAVMGGGIMCGLAFGHWQSIVLQSLQIDDNLWFDINSQERPVEQVSAGC